MKENLLVLPQGPNSPSLAKIEQASILIKEAKSLDEALVLKAIFKEAEVKARRQGLTDVEQRAIEYKFWVNDKIGELLTDMKKAGELSEGNPSKLNYSKKTIVKTLKEIGLTPKESSQFQQFHALPESKKSEIIETAKKRVRFAVKKTIEDLLPKPEIEETPIPKEVSVKIYNCDFFDLDMKDESIDFILTDPPWSLAKHLAEWEKLSKMALKKLKQNRIMITYSSHRFLPDAIQAVKNNGMLYWNILCIVLNSTRQIPIDGYFEEWRPAVVFYRDKWLHKEPCTDLIDCDAPEKRYHTWGQGVSAAEQIIRFHSKPNDLLFEPFAGGGSFIEAAINQKRNVIACEIDKDQYGILKQRFPEACQD